jgi:hypothetical protein
MKINTEAQYFDVLKRVEELFGMTPKVLPNTPLGNELNTLIDAIEAYDDIFYDDIFWNGRYTKG